MSNDKRETSPFSGEAAAVAARYARRDAQRDAARYCPLDPAVYLATQERERALIELICYAGLVPVIDKTVLEIGSGAGGNLLQFIRLGFRPENLVANELLEERLALARLLLPKAVRIAPGNALDLAYGPNSFDAVLQSTVFSSLLDDDFCHALAQRMWTWVKPGGGIIWYDLSVNNPSNPDVRGVSLRKVRQLFPGAAIRTWRVTLAPPISRVVTKIHPAFYGLINIFPILRTHLLCWLSKRS